VDPEEAEHQVVLEQIMLETASLTLADMVAEVILFPTITAAVAAAAQHGTEE
jgi:hypothetical protein